MILIWISGILFVAALIAAVADLTQPKDKL